MTYRQAVSYLESFVNYERISCYPYRVSYKLQRFKAFLARIGNPQDALRCLHIAGSKGKGSTCVLIASILRQSGYRVGLYTSPHLEDFRERIRILFPGASGHSAFDGMIARKELARLVMALRPDLEAYNKTSPCGPLTFFEVYTALAFLYFKEKKTDFVVLETGLGGRLDATNVVSSLVSVITPLSLEHTDKLGKTIEKIAAQKAGIIKPYPRRHASIGRPVVVCAPQERKAMQVIKRRAQECKATLRLVGRDILYKGSVASFTVTTALRRYPRLRLQLCGSHQLVNAAAAIAAVEEIRPYPQKVSSDAVRRGLSRARWPGRCEAVGSRPLIVLDGAQNRASAAVLVQAVRESFDFGRVILIIGVCDDKDAKGVASVLGAFADAVITTRADTPRALDPARLAGHFRNACIEVSPDTSAALAKALVRAAKDDLILVAGSLFVVGEIRRLCAGKKERV